MTGHDAGHRALEAQLHALLARGLPQLLAVLGEQLLVGGDDVLAGRASPRSRYSRAGSIPPISSTIRSEPVQDLVERAAAAGQHARELGAQAGDRARSGRLRGAAARRTRRRPCRGPSSPTRKRAAQSPSLDVPAHEVLVGLAAHDHARLAVAAEDHRRARDAVVVVGHRVAVGAGGGRDDHVARARVGQRRVADDHVAGLAVLAGQWQRSVAAASGRSAITAS